MPVRESSFQFETIEDVMVDARLTGLALLSIHRKISADLTTETVMDRFAKTLKRVLDFVL